jgi:CheY-like chemotaxis protein
MTSEKKTTGPRTGASKLEDILDRLDAAAGITTSDRNQRRWNYRRMDTQACFEHPGGGVTRVSACTRSLWCEGMSLLCAGFVYSGSVFKTNLKSRDGESMGVVGTIVSCRHIDGLFHEIEVKFNQRIDPHLFIDATRNSNGESTAPVDLPSLRGKVLHLDDSEADSRLLMHHLRGSGIELKSVRKAEEALEALKTADFDIFLCDLNLGGGSDGILVVKKVREFGFCGPIVVMSAETNVSKVAAMKAAGAEHVLAKPYQRNALIQMMVKMHQQVGAIVDGEVLYSTLSDEPETDELLANYVASTQQTVKDMQKPILARDLSAVREYCLNIHGTAAGYGFIPLGLAAEEAIRALDSTMSVEEARPQIRRLTLLCGQLGLRRNPTADKKTDANRLV